jgi:two-component system sensor histidine kinase BaeS
MKLVRPLGVRMHIGLAMVALAIVSVALAGLLMHSAADDELRSFGREDLEQTVRRLALTAQLEYEETGRWSPDFVRDLQAQESFEDHAVMLLDVGGLPVPGSVRKAPDDSRRLPVFARGERVGTVIAGHARGGYLLAGQGASQRQLDAELEIKLDERRWESAGIAAVLALLLGLIVALRVSQPLHRVTAVARRMANGEIESRAVGSGGSRETQELARTLDRLAAALRRQDEVRRATAADVAHEMRNALVGVVGRLEAIQDGVVPDEKEALQRTARDARRVYQLVDDIAMLAEAQRPSLLVRKQPVDLHDLCAERVAAHIDRFRDRGVELEARLGRARVDGDPERLVQILDNLLSNALRYTDPGDRVTVALEVRRDQVVMQVADTGIGIAPEHIGRIFDRFWRAPASRDRAAEGSGVGLAVVRDLVIAQDGRIDVESRLGGGSTFSVFLRRADAAPDGRWDGPAPDALAGDAGAARDTVPSA